MAVVYGADRHSNHLALGLGDAALPQHEVIGHADERGELGIIKGVGAQNVGDEAKLFLTFGKVSGILSLKPGLRPKLKRCKLAVLRHDVRRWSVDPRPSGLTQPRH